LRELLFTPILIEFTMLVFTFIICLFEWMMVDDYMSSKFSSRFNLVACAINEIFTFCLLGQRLELKSAAICEKIYNMKWEQLKISKNSDLKLKSSKEMRSLMVITMIRANRTESISAGGLMEFNLSTYMAVSLKTAC
jgi:7tm Odorant receptor